MGGPQPPAYTMNPPSAHDYRRALASAYALPIGLFWFLPLLLPMIAGGFSGLPAALPFLLAPLLPITLLGYWLAPRAGAWLQQSVAASFGLAALSALAAPLPLALPLLLAQDYRSALAIVGLFAVFALPASVWGALLFIGACQRLHAPSVPPPYSQPDLRSRQ